MEIIKLKCLFHLSCFLSRFGLQIDNSMTVIESEIQSATNDSVEQALDTLDATQVTVEDAFTNIEDAVKEVCIQLFRQFSVL